MALPPILNIPEIVATMYICGITTMLQTLFPTSSVVLAIVFSKTLQLAKLLVLEQVSYTIVTPR